MKYYAVIDTNVLVSAVMAFNKNNEDSSSYIVLYKIYIFICQVFFQVDSVLTPVLSSLPALPFP